MTVKFADMKLSRIIPQHVHAVKFRWLHRDFMTMSDRYREIRARTSHPMDACKWCGYAFANGDVMALAQPEKGVNWVLCQTCAQMLEKSSELETNLTRLPEVIEETCAWCSGVGRTGCPGVVCNFCSGEGVQRRNRQG